MVAVTERSTALLEAQEKARNLLRRIEQTEILKVGVTEQQANDQICELAEREFGVTKHWHKRIVRTGINSVLPYKANPENLTIEHNDLVYLDLGPVFEDFEGDIGVTYLLGEDSKKKKLVEDLEIIFKQCKEHYLNNPTQTGAEYFDYIVSTCAAAGWDYGNKYAGHIVGEFSHIAIYGDLPDYRIWPQNTVPMNTPLPDGNTRYWILEIHLVHPQKKYGGFFEDLLNL
jgi:Xaa-Pro aminopeptidase